MAAQQALLIIDMQLALTEQAFARDATVARIALLATAARAANVPVIYIQHESVSWPPLQHGAPGWAIDPALAARTFDTVIQKQASDAFTGTELEAVLHQHGVRQLIVTGMMTEGCVDSTCRRALGLGYNVLLVTDGHSTWDSTLGAEQIIAHHNAALADLPFPGSELVALPAAAIVF